MLMSLHIQETSSLHPPIRWLQTVIRSPLTFSPTVQTQISNAPSASVVAPLSLLPLVTIYLVLGSLNWTQCLDMASPVLNRGEKSLPAETETTQDEAILDQSMGTHHQPIHQDPSAPKEMALSRMRLPALLALLTCPELVVGAALQHRATVMGTAGETPLSPPAWGKAPGSGHCLLLFPSQLPGAPDTFFLLCHGRNCPSILGFAQILTEKGLQCLTDV